MTPRGIAEVEKPVTPHFAVTHNTTNINAPNSGNVQTGGQGNTQTISVSPDFDKAINSLLQLVQSSSLEPHDKDELRDEVVKVNTLALKEASPGILDKIKSRMSLISSGLTAAGLIVKAKPYIETLWNYFKIKYNL
jgi:predicted metalloendopeptidase